MAASPSSGSELALANRPMGVGTGENVLVS